MKKWLLDIAEQEGENKHHKLMLFYNKVENKSALRTCFRVSPALSSSPRIANATARLYCITAPAVASVLGNHAAHTQQTLFDETTLSTAFL